MIAASNSTPPYDGRVPGLSKRPIKRLRAQRSNEAIEITERPMKMESALSQASGVSRGDCHFLAMRFDNKYGYTPGEAESWVFQASGGAVHKLFGGLQWFTSLWRSRAGVVYVTSAEGEVYINPEPEPRKAPWQTHPLKGVLSGVWGLDDSNVFVWGLNGPDKVMYHWNGRAWNGIASPGDVVGMHGRTADFILAVGAKGLIARWDGAVWTPMPSPTNTVLSSVHVESEDEIYAVGPGGRVLTGSHAGWVELVEGPGPMYGVTKFRDTVWIAGAEEGLLKLIDNKVEVFKPKAMATGFDSRACLLVSCDDKIVDSEDGQAFWSLPVAPCAETMAKAPPLWLE